MMYTRQEFEELRIAQSAKMAADSQLQSEAIQLITHADKYHWIHQTSWMGEPCLQLPQDLLAIHDIIYRTKPRAIVEIGTAWGGSTLFYASHTEVQKVICVDIYIPPDLPIRLRTKSRKPLKFIAGSSTDQTIFELVKKELDDKPAMVILDSNHTAEHVANELELYSTLVQPGQYLLCDDTIIEHMANPTRERDWGPGNNPMTALKKFLANHHEFVPDHQLMNRLLLSCAPGGYLQRV